MQMNKLIRKQVTLSIFSFVLISLLIIGTSSAYLRGMVTTSSYKSQIGKLNIEFTNGSTIAINTDPLDDNVAITSTQNIYDFKVSNNGSGDTENIPYTYKVLLKSSSGQTTDFDTRFIKYCLIEGNDGVDVSSTAFTTANCSPKSISSTTTFNTLQVASKENLTITSGKNSKSYRLKVWLSNKYGDILAPNSVIGKTYNLDIMICGQAGTKLSDLKSC